jgi:hypothetical protein
MRRRCKLDGWKWMWFIESAGARGNPALSHLKSTGEFMKRTTIAMAIGVALLVGVAFAHDHEEFEGWMKITNASFGSLRKTVEAKQGPETAASAEKLVGVFEHVQAHFEDHHMEDGVNFAKTGRDAAKDLASAANSGNWEKASVDLKAIGGTCQGCHTAHREKLPDGSYKMK